MFFFKIKIAEVVFAVSANFIETQNYFSDFITSEPEEVVITLPIEEIGAFNEKMPDFTLEMCERAVLKYKVDCSLVSFGAFPFHASALSYKGKGYIFTALSGVGKSTHSRLWKEQFGDSVVIINDDRPYLKVTSSGVIVCSHPQSGKHGIYTNTTCKLNAICKIVRDESNHIKKVPKASFFPFMVQQSFTLDTPELTAKIIKLIKDVLNKVIVYEIHCNISDSTALEICNSLQNHESVYNCEETND